MNHRSILAMRGLWLALAATAPLLSGCADPARSRDVANPQVAGAVLAQQVCSNCHGVTGDATSPNFPKLAGQPEAYLSAQLKAFRSERRRDLAGTEYMWGLTRRLTDEQIDGLARYYAAQRPTARAAALPGADPQAGQSLYAQGLPDHNVTACATCHGAHGEGQATFPRLAGQHADYVVKQLLVFRSSDDRPDGGVMEVIAHGLQPQQIRDVAAYLQAMDAPRDTEVGLNATATSP